MCCLKVLAFVYTKLYCYIFISAIWLVGAKKNTPKHQSNSIGILILSGLAFFVHCLPLNGIFKIIHTLICFLFFVVATSSVY